MALDLKKFITQAEEQLAPGLEARISRLAKEEREEQLYGAEKLQQAGRFTSGFRPGLMAKIMDIFAGRKEEARGEVGAKALSVAQQLYGLAHEAELQEKRIDAEARMKELDRKLTKQGWSFQAKQAEMDRQLTKEGWDWQSKENILNRTLSREELAQQATLTREGYSLQERLARLAREGIGGGVSAPTGRAPTLAPTYTAPTKTVAPKTKPTPTPTSPKAYSKAISTYYASLGQAPAYKPAITSAAKTAFGRRPGGVYY